MPPPSVKLLSQHPIRVIVIVLSTLVADYTGSGMSAQMIVGKPTDTVPPGRGVVG